jgi:hypothetical protein
MRTRGKCQARLDLTYRHDKVTARNILPTEFNLDDVVARIMRCIKDIERAILVIHDIDIQIVAQRRTNATSHCTWTCLVCIDSDGVFFAHM